MNRAERRERTYKKWISRLKALWNSNVLWDNVSEVKTTWTVNGPEADSFADFKRDKFGVKCKNTGTILCDNKRLSIQEERRRNLDNRKVPDDWMDEIYNQ